MAVEKGKVIPVLTEAVKGKGYSKTFIEKMAAKLAEKIEDDDSIQSYIDDRLDILIEADAEADRRATLAVDKAKKPDTKNDEPTLEDELPADTPSWAKALIAQNKKLEEKVNGFEQQRTAETIEQRFRKDERVKDLPAIAFKGRIPKTEDEFEAFADELATDWKDYQIQTRQDTFGNDIPPASGVNQPVTNKKPDADLAQYSKLQNESSTKNN